MNSEMDNHDPLIPDVQEYATQCIKVEPLQAEDYSYVHQHKQFEFVKIETNQTESTGLELDISEYKCNICHELFTDEFTLGHHINIHHRDYRNEEPVQSVASKGPHYDVKLYKCPDCEKSFTIKPELTRHLIIHNDDRPYSCQVEGCTKSFKRKDKLIGHMRTVHSDDRPFICKQTECKKSFKTKDNLICHTRAVHSDERPFKCEEIGCTKSYKKKDKLTVHMRTEHSIENSYNSQQTECSTSPETQGRLNRHVTVHGDVKLLFPNTEEKEIGTHQITKQSEDYPYSKQGKQSADNISETVKTEFHLIVPEYNCYFCVEVFNDETRLKQHVYEHHQDDLKVEKAPVQPLASVAVEDGNIHVFGRNDEKHKLELNKHREVHSVKGPYKCQTIGCAKWFTDRYELNRHMGVHSDERPFKCEEAGCMKTFKRKDKLIGHIRTAHSDERPFKCEEAGCTKSFKAKDKLAIHMSVVHSDERPFKCAHIGCTKTFKRKDFLTGHIRTVHSDGRPFSCQET